jgi:drug/metabolite transporter (DMT)-like permease
MQRFTSAVHTVLIFSLEPVFAAIFGVWLHRDRLQAIAWAGAALILAGMLVAELGGYLAKRAGAKGIIPT